MTLNFIGVGLYDEKDITVNGLEAVKDCDHVFLEYYTSKLACDVSKLEKLYGKKVTIADRELVEQKAEDEILARAIDNNVAFLVIGDIFSATTHVDLMMRAKEKGIECKYFHNASVLNAVGITGLELYKFGKATSIPFGHENITTPIDVFNKNYEMGMHTLFLLDLAPLEKKFMKINEAAEFLISKGVDSELMSVGCAGLGSPDFEIKYSKLSEMKGNEFTKYPQCLIIPSKNLHFVEEDCLNLYK